MTEKAPLDHYKDEIRAGHILVDPEQERAVHALDNLYHELMIAHTKHRSWGEWLRGFGKPSKQAPKGLYMYGGVGRGKSMLMDLFFEALPDDMPKRRVHFHAFMIEVHDYFHSRRQSGDISEGVDGLIPSLVSVIKQRSKVLCFDEFHVTDVADAMILGRLFTALIDQGVVVVATSNWEPDKLYEDGLQRDRFVPFIKLLKNRMHIIHLDHGVDYRDQFLAEEGSYFYPLGPKTSAKLDALFEKMTLGKAPHTEVLEVKGREIVAHRAVGYIARFSFAELCEQPHGAEDYIKIAETFHTVFLEDVPKLSAERRNEVKRLMILIDAFYEAKVKLVMSADALADDLYTGDDHGFEFERTVSRLHEMQNT